MVRNNVKKCTCGHQPAVERVCGNCSDENEKWRVICRWCGRACEDFGTKRSAVRHWNTDKNIIVYRKI